MRWWPAFAPLSVVLIESRMLVTTPSLSASAQANPDDELVKTVHDALPDVIIGSGVSLLGVAAMVLFVVAFVDWIRGHSSWGVAPVTMLVGAAVAAAGVMVGFGVYLSMGAASEEAAPTSVAAVYVIADSLAYMGWTAFGLVTGAAFFALREVPAPVWIRWFSLVITVLFLVCAFLPFLSWAPALLWLLVVGLGLLFVPATRDPGPVAS
jgi:hypothetical protein